MAGRPHARQTKVTHVNDVNVIMDMDINHRYLCILTEDNGATIDFLASHRLLANSFNCDRCNGLCSLIAYAQGSDGIRWKCRPCNFAKSIRTNSFFQGSHLSLPRILDLMYFWSVESPNSIFENEVGANKNTVMDWANFMCDICCNWGRDNPATSGGLDDDGQPIVVQVDETKYFHRKYTRGEWHEGHWVFEAVDTQNPHIVFLIEIRDRRARTVLPIIQDHVAMGSMIHSDQWSEYNNITNLPNGYGHMTVNHQHFLWIHKPKYIHRSLKAFGHMPRKKSSE